MIKALIILLVAIVAVQAQDVDNTTTVAPTTAPGTTLINVIFDPLFGGAGLGLQVQLKGGLSYTLHTAFGFDAIVKVKTDCKVGLGIKLQVLSNLPQSIQQMDFSQLKIAVNAAFGIYVDNDGALEQVTLISPPLPILGQELANGINAGVLALDKVTGTNQAIFSSVLKAEYNQETKRITVSLPPNLPMIVFAKVQSRISATYGAGISTIAGANQTLTWDATSAVTFRSNVANVITAIKTNVTTVGTIKANAARKAGTPLGVFLDLSLQTKADHESTIRISYNEQDLIKAGIKNEANLKLAYFNEGTGQWDFTTGVWGTFVNTTAHYIEARVSHFSTWAPIEASGVQNSASSASVSIVIMAVCAVFALFQ